MYALGVFQTLACLSCSLFALFGSFADGPINGFACFLLVCSFPSVLGPPVGIGLSVCSLYPCLRSPVRARLKGVVGFSAVVVSAKVILRAGWVGGYSMSWLVM